MSKKAERLIDEMIRGVLDRMSEGSPTIVTQGNHYYIAYNSPSVRLGYPIRYHWTGTELIDAYLNPQVKTYPDLATANKDIPFVTAAIRKLGV